MKGKFAGVVAFAVLAGSLGCGGAGSGPVAPAAGTGTTEKPLEKVAPKVVGKKVSAGQMTPE
jgi:hypothetical protein